jgi:small redox-active disulfide protein 2
MKQIQIFGPGCPNCRKLAENAVQAAKELGIDYEIEKITDLNVITGFGVMFTPALAVNGQVKVSGKVSNVAEIKKMLV